jgi:hypothetical protein
MQALQSERFGIDPNPARDLGRRLRFRFLTPRPSPPTRIMTAVLPG